jgi:hypothetical protein
MKKVTLAMMILVISILVIGCAAPAAAPAVEEPLAVEEVAEAALMVGDTGFSRADLEGMNTITAESTSKDGETTEYTGVLAADLVAEAGLSGDTVVFTASDGYEAELALAELEGCADCIVAFDGDSLRMVLPGFPGNVQVKDVVAISTK